MKGVVLKSTGSWYVVKLDNGNLLDCRLKGKFRIKQIKSTNPIVVGDIVKLEKTGNAFMIIELFERRNSIVRKSVNLSKQQHVIAANIDQAILMVTLEKPVTTTSFIDRFLVAANAYDVEVILVFNKMDIYNKKIKCQQEDLKDLYENIGYKTIALSTLNDDLSHVKEIMKGNTFIDLILCLD